VTVAKLFFSYAHEDEALRDELAKHLVMLQRQGLLEMWHDRRITAGQPLDHTIRHELDQAGLVLFLVSPDFLASDYCYDVEVDQAMTGQARGEATVIPVILRPCDWKSAPFGHLLAAPKDGKPVTTWPSRDQAFLDVVRAIRAALSEQRVTRGAGTPAGPGTEPAVDRPKILSRNLEIARTFSERERDDFLHAAFEYMATFFQNSLAALGAQHPGHIETRYRPLDAARFTAVVYRDGKAVARCTIWMDGGRRFTGGIGYVANDSGDTNGLNESLTVETDGREAYLKPLGMAFIGREPPGGKLSTEGAAEYLWSLFLGRIQEDR
jgi:TIR domain